MRNITRNGVFCGLLAFTCALGTVPFSSLSAANSETEMIRPPAIAIDVSHSTRLVTLGTVAGPRAQADRSGSANLLQVGDRFYLIDAGPGVSHRLAASGVQPAQVQKIFITHLHFDHAAGIASLFGFAWMQRTGQLMDIYGPPATQAFIAGALHYLSIPEGIYAAELPPTPPISEMVRAHDIDVSGPTVIYQDDLVKVTAVENSHYDTIPRVRRPTGAHRSYAYRFDTPDRSIVFTGDTGPSEAIVELAKGADILVTEVMDMDATLATLAQAFNSTPDKLKAASDHMLQEHMSPQAVGDMAQRAGVKMVVLSHLGIPAGAYDERILSQGVRQRYAGPIAIANDGSEF